MIRKQHCAHDFATLPAPEQFIFGGNVITKITANVLTFTALPITLAALGTANGLLQTTYSAYQLGGEGTKGAFENAQHDWILKFTKTCDYCDLVADGNLDTINKSGFNATDGETVPAVHLAVLPNIDIFGVRPSGKVIGKCDKLTGTKAYVYMLAADTYSIAEVGDQLNVMHLGQIVASFSISTSITTEFNGLPPLTHFTGKAAGVNSAGLGDLSGGMDVSTQ